MITVKQLEKRFCEQTSEDKGAVRYVCRVLQDAGLLPIGRRGLSKNAPTLTVEQIILFIFGYYGAAAPKNAAKVAGLIATLGDELGGQTLLEIFKDYIRAWELGGGPRDHLIVIRILFIQRDDWPSVEIETIERNKDPDIKTTAVYGMTHDGAGYDLYKRIPAVRLPGTIFEVLATIAGEADD